MGPARGGRCLRPGEGREARREPPACAGNRPPAPASSKRVPDAVDGASSGELRRLPPLAPGSGPREARTPARLALPATVAWAAASPEAVSIGRRVSRLLCNVSCRRALMLTLAAGRGARNPLGATVKWLGQKESLLLKPLRGF